VSPRQHGRQRRPDTGAGREDREAAPVKERWVGQLARNGRFLVAAPFFERGRRVNVDRTRDARPGDLVLVHSGTTRRAAPKIERVLGKPDVARVVLEALMLDRGLARRFPAGVERAAQEARDRGQAGQLDGAHRRDLTELATFTIDPVSAKDFDDAISAEQLAPGRWRIWVHIADVGAYVKPGSPVDREAYQRGTSVYVPGAVEPMLPEALSNDACSLRPGVERLAVTVEIELNGADVAKASFYRSTIRSDKRLDYDEVDRIFAGSVPFETPWGEPLQAARAAAQALDARRAERGALAIESSEPEFAFDRRGHISAAKVGVQTESHRLIEHLMIAANEQVATRCAERGVPTLYRVHEHPTAEAVEQLIAQLHSLDVATPPMQQGMSAQQAAETVAAASRLIAEHVARTGHGRRALTTLVLRALKRAYYSPENKGHAGLSSPRYCHFTSPIRRYPDLVAHRALLSTVGGEEDAPRAAVLPEAGEWTSARERNAMSIERAADDIARCFLLERELGGKVGAEFDGEVIGLIGAGAFVAFGDGYEGMLPVRRMRGDWWELNEHGTILYAAESGRTIRLGDPIRVAVHRIEAPRGRVELDIA
jgi:ribonuclease R